jgi:SAM-dependent methyltransferase
MCDKSCIDFGVKFLTPETVKDKRIIDLGALDVNGSLRYHTEQYKPKKYIGVDLDGGPCVDIVCDVEDIEDFLPDQQFDIVISTEMIEHVYNWKNVINIIKRLCKPDGMIIITTRSYGFPLHSWPTDQWRFEVDDMKYIFSDCSDVIVENDWQNPGVFVKAIKPYDYNHLDLRDYELYNINDDRRK